MPSINGFGAGGFRIGPDFSRALAAVMPSSETAKALYDGSATSLRNCLEGFRSGMSAPSEAISTFSSYLDAKVMGTLIGTTDTESRTWKEAPLLNRGMASSLRIIGSGISAPFAGIACLLSIVGNLDKIPEQCLRLKEKLSTPEGRFQFAEEASKIMLQTGSSMAGALLGFTIIASLPVSWPIVAGGLALAGLAILARVVFNAYAASDDEGKVDIKRFTGKMMKDIGEAMLAFGVGICWGAAASIIVTATNSTDISQIFGRREAMASMTEGRDLISSEDTLT